MAIKLHHYVVLGILTEIHKLLIILFEFTLTLDVLVEFRYSFPKCNAKFFLFIYLQNGPSSESDPGQLLIPNVTLSDSGWYTCIVSNQHDQSVSRSAWLNVIPAPQTHISSFLAERNFIGISAGAGTALFLFGVIMSAAVYFKMRHHRHQVIPWSKNALYGPMPSFEPIDSQWEFTREKYGSNIYLNCLRIPL